MADRCAGFELFRQLPEVSVGRGVSRFMQNGTQLPGDEAASNAVRPYRITRASFVRRPLDAATPSLLLSPPPREPLSAPERGPSVCIYIYTYIRMYPRTISIFEATARLLLLLLPLSKKKKVVSLDSASYEARLEFCREGWSIRDSRGARVAAQDFV